MIQEVVTARCLGCGETIDIAAAPFIDNEDMPIVLDVQLRVGGATEASAIEFVLANHGIDRTDYEDDGELTMYHYSDIGQLSHEEPGNMEHLLDLTEKGYWSFG